MCEVEKEFCDGSVENRRSSPVTAWETEFGTFQEEERVGVWVPEEDGVPRSRLCWSW